MAQTKNEFGWTLLATATASASATIDFDTGIDWTVYDKYVLSWTDVRPATTDSYMLIRVSTDGGSTYDAGASDYLYGEYVIQADTNGTQSSISTSAILMGHSTLNDGISNSNSNCGGEIVIMKPDTTDVRPCLWYKIWYRNSNGYSLAGHGCGTRIANQNTDGIRVLMDSGNIASGTFKLYGIN